MLSPLLDALVLLIVYRNMGLQERPALPRGDRGEESCAVDGRTSSRLLARWSRFGDDVVVDDAGLVFMASTCTSKVCLNLSAVRAQTAHGFHCLCEKSSPDMSMLCPQLLDVQNPLILCRNVALQRRPALPRQEHLCAVSSAFAMCSLRWSSLHQSQRFGLHPRDAFFLMEKVGKAQITEECLRNVTR